LLDLDRIPETKSDFQLEEIDGELLLYSPESTQSVYLNASASLIWRLCDGNQSIREIIQLLSEAFPDAGEAIEEDVVQSIENFLENEAIDLK